MNYKEKADRLFLIFGEKRLKAVEMLIEELEQLIEQDDSEFIAISLGYWYNVEAEIKKQDEEDINQTM